MNQRIRYCTHKVTHITREGAEEMRDRMKRRAGVAPGIYKCEWCGLFHVGYTKSMIEELSPRELERYNKAHE